MSQISKKAVKPKSKNTSRAGEALSDARARQDQLGRLDRLDQLKDRLSETHHSGLEHVVLKAGCAPEDEAE